MFKAILTLVALPIFALAAPQIYGPAPGPAAPTTSQAVAAAAPSAPPDSPGHVNVDVGFQNGFVFHPSNFTAPNGTVVTFFFPNNGVPHSVVQSAFSTPCTPLAATNSTPAGFDSGITMGTEFSITITDDTTPIWFFCKFPLHCGMGMVGAINAPTTGNQTFDGLQAAALAIGGSEPNVPDNGPVTGGVGADATAGPTSAGASPTGSTGTSGTTTSGAGRLVASSSLGLLVIVMAVAVAL
ncbi:Cupredoxin [Abortiporus biennis]|nr:Cupredoxin [Abortiporus biennis]